jgi:uncharacterized membrane protein YphA (DoxX/SURF4 family)
MNIWLWIAQVLLAAVYLWVGGTKVFRTVKARASMKFTQGRSDSFIRFIGISEMLGGLGLILPIALGILPFFTPLAAIGLTIIQALAIITEHLPKKEYKDLPKNLLLLALSVMVIFGRWALFF